MNMRLGDSIRRRLKEASEGRRRWRRWALALAALTAVCFGAGYALATLVIFPPVQASVEAVAVPDLRGLTREAAAQRLGQLGLALGELTELPHPRAAPGVILAQSPLPGQRLRSGAPVRVALSAGKARARVPDLVGLAPARAEALLGRLGFQVARREELSDLEAGKLVRVEPAPGTELELPARVTLVVSAGLIAPEPMAPPGPVDDSVAASSARSASGGGAARGGTNE
ncbi:MAG: PASTA domain-containing protein [Gemmatimonadetes bacterium]|nr:PASTA domain-containing protein [Gemmatimonadota bacterium]